jgi:hypothetical protein
MLAHCNKGKWYPRIGGSGGGDVYIDSKSGFNKLEVHYDDWINGINIFKLEGGLQTTGNIKGKTAVIDCKNKPIKGIIGTYKSDYNQKDDSPNSENFVFSID